MDDSKPQPDFESFDAYIAEAMEDPEYAAAARRIERRDRWLLPLDDWLRRVWHRVTFNTAHDWRVRPCDHGEPCWGTHPYCKVCGKDGQP